MPSETSRFVITAPVTNSGTSNTPATDSFTSATDELAIGVYESTDVTGRTVDGNGRIDDGFFPALALLFDKTGAASSSYSWPQANSAVWAAIGVSFKGIATTTATAAGRTYILGQGMGMR